MPVKTWQEETMGGAFLVETQERNLAACLRAQDVEVIVKRLTPEPSADVVFKVKQGMVLVERKAASDLLQSWITKQGSSTHLMSQIDRMLATPHFRVILAVEGWYGLTEKGYLVTGTHNHRLLWDGLWNMLSRVQAQGVHLQFAVDTPHLAHRLVSLREYWSKQK